MKNQGNELTKSREHRERETLQTLKKSKPIGTRTC